MTLHLPAHYEHQRRHARAYMPQRIEELLRELKQRGVVR